MANVFHVADWFLSKEAMTHKKLQKLQKLCYYAQAWSYAIFPYPISCDGVFEAWVHGPVCRALYAKHKGYGFDYIPRGNAPAVFGRDESAFLENVWDTYGDMSANSLEALSHSEPPWQKARAGLDSGAPSNVQIRPKDMADYYRSIYTGGDA